MEPGDEVAGRVGRVAAGEVLVDQRDVLAVVDVGRDRDERALRVRRLLDEREHAAVVAELDDRVLPRELDVAAVAHRDRARLAELAPPRDVVGERELEEVVAGHDEQVVAREPAAARP